MVNVCVALTSFPHCAGGGLGSDGIPRYRISHEIPRYRVKSRTLYVLRITHA